MNIFEIATKISDPLTLAGFVSASIFLIFKQIIQQKLIPKLNRVQGLDLIKIIINRLFQLSVLALLLGFASQLIPENKKGNVTAELTSEQKRILENWKTNTASKTAVLDITSNSSNSRYGEKDIDKLGWGNWHTPDGKLIADFSDQRKVRVYFRESNENILVGGRDFIGNITPVFPYTALGNSMKADIYRISGGQSPPKLILITEDFNSIIFVIGTYYE